MTEAELAIARVKKLHRPVGYAYAIYLYQKSRVAIILPDCEECLRFVGADPWGSADTSWPCETLKTIDPIEY